MEKVSWAKPTLGIFECFTFDLPEVQMILVNIEIYDNNGNFEKEQFYRNEIWFYQEAAI